MSLTGEKENTKIKADLEGLTQTEATDVNIYT